MFKWIETVLLSQVHVSLKYLLERKSQKLREMVTDYIGGLPIIIGRLIGAAFDRFIGRLIGIGRTLPKMVHEKKQD